MRLVDADALMQTYAKFVAPSNNSDFENEPTWNDAVSLLESAQTVDAVEVIRCENCRWFGEEDEDGQCWCHFNDISTLKHSFCSHGERRKK